MAPESIFYSFCRFLYSVQPRPSPKIRFLISPDDSKSDYAKIWLGQGGGTKSYDFFSVGKSPKNRQFYDEKNFFHPKRNEKYTIFTAFQSNIKAPYQP